MTRSMYSGVSGLGNMQTGMDVIGNNVSNVSTPGYKSTTLNFQDLLSQTVQGASAPQGNMGGTNPMQIGLGMSAVSITSNFTDGTYQPTNNPSDMALSGSGFFVLSNGNDRLYTRAGSFTVDKQGNYVSSNGYKLMGYVADANGKINSGGAVQAIQVAKGSGMAAQITTKIAANNNLQASAAIGTSYTTSATATDSLGNQHAVNTSYYKVADNTWLAKLAVTDPTKPLATGLANDFQVLNFTNDGQFLSAQQALPDNKVTLGISGLDGTSGVVQQKTWTANLNGSLHTFTLQTTSQSVSPSTTGPWKFDLSDSINGATPTTTSGTIAWDGTNYTMSGGAASLGTLPVNYLKMTGASAPVAGQLNVDAEVATDIPLTSLQLDSAADSSHTQNFTTIVNGVPQTYAMTFTKAKTTTTGATNSWNYTITQQGVTGASPVTGTIDEIAGKYTGFPTTIGGAKVTGTGKFQYQVDVGIKQLDDTVPILPALPTPQPQTWNANINGVTHNYTLTTTATGAAGNNGTWSYTLDDSIAGATPSVAAGTETSGTIAWDGTNYVFTQTAGGTTLGGSVLNYSSIVSGSSAPTTGASSSGTDTVTPTTNLILPYTASQPNGFDAGTTVGYTTQTLADFNVQFTGGADALAVGIDSTALTQYGGGTTSTVATTGDGYTAGTLNGTTVDASGTIVGSYSNNQKRNLAQVALASFNNAEGLTREGSANYSVSGNSGDAQIGAAQTGGRGKITGGGLEMSNVDLAKEFSNMIIMERSYQANSKIITTSDEMLQELNNLKR